MQTFIAILRGINVSGKNKILMSDLKLMLEGLRFKDVVTYIQSGNVAFKADQKLSNEFLASKIETAIAKQFGFNVPVIVRSKKEIENVIKVNPFLKNKKNAPEKLHVTFLSAAPFKTELESILKFDFAPDEFVILDKEVFLHIPESYGETKLSNKFFESKLKVTATTRNWNTVNKLVEMVQ